MGFPVGTNGLLGPPELPPGSWLGEIKHELVASREVCYRPGPGWIASLGLTPSLPRRDSSDRSQAMGRREQAGKS